MKSETTSEGSGSHWDDLVRYGVVASHFFSSGARTSALDTGPAKAMSGRVEPEATGSVRSIRCSASTYTRGCCASSAAADIRIG